MRILLWHGWLLTGTGSNLYTSNLARVWRAQGHDVLLMCQERDVRGLGYVDEDGDFHSDNRSWTLAGSARGVGGPASPDGSGRCRIVRPCIGGLLPVFVLDEYEGFTVRRFVDLTDGELGAYTQANVAALTHALDAFAPDAIVTGHEVMGPYIALQACGREHRYLAKLHGSGLEYAVKLQERYRDYAARGLKGAAVVAGGSRYMVDEAAREIPGWHKRAVVVNPGCDVGMFGPVPRDPAAPPTIGYVGKLIASKGVHNLFAALGLLQSERLRVVVVGYGGFESGLARLWEALRAGDTGTALDIARRGEGSPLADLVAWLEGGSLTAPVVERLRRIDLTFAGRLGHGPLAPLLPTFDLLVVPSVVPEAFGMVAAEAAAAGVLPVVPQHSGIGEAGATLEEELGRPGLLRFDPTDPIAGIAVAMQRVLALPAPARQELEAAAAATARRLWSWEHVASALLGHAADS